jgi:hypothetical protein
VSRQHFRPLTQNRKASAVRVRRPLHDARATFITLEIPSSPLRRMDCGAETRPRTRDTQHTQLYLFTHSRSHTDTEMPRACTTTTRPYVVRLPVHEHITATTAAARGGGAAATIMGGLGQPGPRARGATVPAAAAPRHPSAIGHRHRALCRVQQQQQRQRHNAHHHNHHHHHVSGGHNH